MILALLLTLQTIPPGFGPPPARPDYPSWAQPIPIVRNPLVTQDTLLDTICNHAKDAKGHTWIHNQRPPTSVTNAIKYRQMDAAGIPRSSAADFELDHVCSIEDGCSPTDERNLRLQPWKGRLNAHTKDKLETALSHDVCKGKRTLDEVQHMLADDWPAAFKAEFGKDPE